MWTGFFEMERASSFGLQIIDKPIEALILGLWTKILVCKSRH